MKTNKMCAILGNLNRYQELMPLTEKQTAIHLYYLIANIA